MPKTDSISTWRVIRSLSNQYSGETKRSVQLIRSGTTRTPSIRVEHVRRFHELKRNYACRRDGGYQSGQRNSCVRQRKSTNKSNGRMAIGRPIGAPAYKDQAGAMLFMLSRPLRPASTASVMWVVAQQEIFGKSERLLRQQ